MKCPVHGIPDCSPLLNGCYRLTKCLSEKEPEIYHVELDLTPEQIDRLRSEAYVLFLDLWSKVDTALDNALNDFEQR